MNLHISLFTILLMASLLKSGYGSTSESCFAKSREEDEKCGKYCYKIVKPLLSYFATLQSKEAQFEDLQNKINDQEKNIKQNECDIQQLKSNVNARDKEIESKDDQLALRNKEIENKDNQIYLKDKQIETKDNQLALKNKEIEMKDIQLKKLESKFSELQLNSISSNCLGKSTDVYMLTLPNIGPFSVSCDSTLAGSGWTVIQRRINGSVDFYRNWDEYKEGFGDLRGEFHMGLEKLHLLTQLQPHELYIHLEDFENNTRYARYSHFVVGNETESFELKNIGEYSGNAGNALNYHLNMKFSTKDRDNDKYSRSCANAYESAGWFNVCSRCDLNGKYTKDGVFSSKKIAWPERTANPNKFVQQMIRPISH